MKQTLSLSPKLQQAIKLLQLSATELDAEIKTALDTNPLLELNYDLDEASVFTGKSYYDLDATNNVNSIPSLHDYLYWQLNLTPFSDQDRIIALTIIDSINDDGYLSASLEDLFLGLKNNYSEFNSVDMAEIVAVLHRVQQFDPPGIAARNVSECMLLQLAALNIDSTLAAQCKILIANYLELLGKKDLSSIKKLMHINDALLKQIIAQIKRLHPKPGTIITADTTEYIVPDVMVEKINGVWQVSLKPSLAQNLRLNMNYANLLRHATNKFDTTSLRKQYAEAQWLLDSIKNRNATLLSVANFIVRYQNEFMELGETMMRPLVLQDIALELGLSESTISRITSRKYMHTPRGTYELKYFFSSHVSGNTGECSSTAVKAIIKELIQQENSAQRLSDQDLCNLIEQRGINIARRTVAKYREALGIQASNLRGA